MTEKEKRNYLEKHIGEELRLLLSSVGVWKLLKEKEAGFIVNIARDSVCVHFRTLIKFFTTDDSGYDISVVKFGIEKPFDSEYKKWIGIIDEAILHIAYSRHNPRKPTNEANDINEQMDNFQKEILTLWEKFIRNSKTYSDLLESVLRNSQQYIHTDIIRAKKIMR